MLNGLVNSLKNNNFFLFGAFISTAILAHNSIVFASDDKMVSIQTEKAISSKNPTIILKALAIDRVWVPVMTDAKDDTKLSILPFTTGKIVVFTRKEYADQFFKLSPAISGFQVHWMEGKQVLEISGNTFDIFVNSGSELKAFLSREDIAAASKR